MSSFTDADGDTFHVENDGYGLVRMRAYNMEINFYTEDAPKIIELIQEVAK